MGLFKRSSPISALDIGSSKVVVVIATRTDGGDIEINGVGSQPSTGVKRGVIANIDSTVEAIVGAITQAEQQANMKITTLYVSIGGNHLHGLNSHGVVAIERDVVGKIDITRVIDAAKAVALSADQQLLHIFPQDFIIDGQAGVKEPVGMRGVRLESKVHIVTAAIAATQNIVRCVENCDRAVSDIVIEQVAGAHAVLTEDEKELGVCLVDIGAGTVSIVTYINGAVRNTEMIPVGGNQITSDISVALRVPVAQAEQLKLTKGDVDKTKVAGNDPLEICVGVSDRRLVKHELLVEVIEARYEEIYILVKQLLVRLGVYQRLRAGIVLTGGASNIPNAVDHAEKIMGISVRHGVPAGFVSNYDNILNPIYTTSLGLLRYALNKEQDKGLSRPRKTHANSGVARNVVRWLQENF